MRNISAKASAVQYLQQIVDLIPSNMSILPSADWRAAHKVYTSNNFRTESSGALVHFDLSPNGALLLLTFEYRIVMLNVATGKEIRQIKYCRDEDYSNFLKKENTYGIKTPLAAAYFSLDGRWMISITSESDKYKSIAVIFDLMAGNPDTYIETFSNDTTLSLTDIEKQTNIEFCHKGNVSIFDEDKREERVLSYPKYRTATSRVGQDAIVKTLVELIDKTAFADASGMMASDKHWLAIETNPKTIQIRSVSEVRGAIIASDAIVGYGFTIDSSGLFVADSAGHITLWHAGSDLPQSPLQ
jgi:hypothetical protein